MASSHNGAGGVRANQRGHWVYSTNGKQINFCSVIPLPFHIQQYHVVVS